MKKELKKYIEFCEKLTFKVGESVELINTEDIIHYGDRYLDGKLTDDQLIAYLEGCGCPNEQFKEYKDPCEGNSEYGCKKCWIEFLKDN